ncbi:uncharacterized protein LOC126985285 [Eriocheir sinensis]|uniref:uncharacterized protein LOC126985285 n=1 Tax=Eriocheir sinensis TaxID=95602 RepID=UPI0021C9BFC3|nr:uncharacterized protein LOC126985285 [Eriocheir sinensis]
MGGSSMLQTGRWLLGMTLVVLAIKVVEAAVLDKDSSDLERFFLGRTVNPICFHNLALCKIACESCDKCYQEYVDCGMSSYYSTKKTATSSTVDLGADAASGSTTLLDDGLEGGATKGSVFTLPRIPVIKLPRIPVIKHPSSWQSVLVSKIRGAIVRTTTSTTTDATDGHGSDVPEHSASVQGPGTNDQSTKGPKSAPRDGDHNQRNTTDSFQHGKHHHHHHEASAGHSKGKPRPINSTVSAGNITATNTEGSLEQSTLPHEFHDGTTESADHHSTEAATTPSHDGDHSAHGDASASTTHHPPSSPNTETSSPTEPEVPPVSTPTRGTTTHKKPHHHHHSKAATPKPSSETKGAPVSSPTAEGTTTRKPHRHSKASTPKSHSSTGTKAPPVPTSAPADSAPVSSPTAKGTTTRKPHSHSKASTPKSHSSTGTKVPPVPTSAPADTTTPTESAHPPSAAPNPELPPSAPVSTPSAADTTTPTESAHPPSGASNPEQPSSVSDSPPTEINHPPSSPDAEQPSSTWGPEEPPAPTPPADW